jgi:bHLH factor
MLPQPRSELDANEMRQANAVSEASAAAATAVAALAGAYPALSGTSTTALAGLEHPYAIPSHVPDRNPYLNPMFSKAPSPPRQGPKPPVGSEEWHKVRRDNHKEVERRRRETINEGINELAKIVPGCEKNKGSILQRAVSFIAQLKQNEQNNIEKWTLEKLLMEQAISELSNNVERLKHQYDEAVQEAQMWRKMCQDAGLTADKDDTVAAAAAAADDDIARNGDAEA